MKVKQINTLEILKEQNKIKKVCAYARVSTDVEKQLNSFDVQVAYYTKLILEHKNYEFAGVFADEGISGTSLNKRDQFNLMIKLAKHGNIDLILTKSISRFSRNVIDTLSILQDLRNHKVEVFFEKENISSFDPKIEFVITVLASMAEEESRNISENVKWSVRNKFKTGEYFLNTKNLLAYKRDKNGDIYIDDTEASLVKEIFDLYISGMGTARIARLLTERGIKTIRGKSKWHVSSVKGILSNEKYTGAALLQKTVNLDFRHKNSINNDNHLPKYYVENSHQAIIDLDTFKKAQDKLHERTPNEIKAHKKYINSGHITKYAGLCICNQCNNTFRHKINNSGTQYERAILICSSNDDIKTCQNDSIFVNSFELIVSSKINQIITNQDMLLTLARNALEKDKAYVELLKQKSETEHLISALELKLSDSINDRGEFDHMVAKEINNQLKELKIEYSYIINELSINYNNEVKLYNLKRLINQLILLKGDYTTFDYKQLFSKVIILNRDEIIFELNLRHNPESEIGANELILKATTTHNIRKVQIETKHSLRI